MFITIAGTISLLFYKISILSKYYYNIYLSNEQFYKFQPIIYINLKTMVIVLVFFYYFKHFINLIIFYLLTLINLLVYLIFFIH